MSFSRSNRISEPRSSRSLRPLLIAALLSAGTLPWMLPALAEGTAAGTSITNTATGSFTNPNDSTNTVQTVNSNAVIVTVAEVAGVTVTATGAPVEAPATVANPGPNQGDGQISAGDVVYLTYNIRNIGNDPTQFFLPSLPSSVVNGAVADGTIQIIGYNPNGQAGNTTDLTANNILIPSGGSTTGTLLNGVAGTNNGSVPADGFITIRVPVKIDAGVTSPDQVTVVIGNTPPNDSSQATQNQTYSASGNNTDIYTVDNTGTANGDTAGAPANGDREASASQSFGLGTPNVDYGDLPDPTAGTGQNDYQTLAANNGPRHIINGTTYLGTGVTADADGYGNSSDASADSLDDGITVNGSGLQGQSFVQGQQFTFDIITAGSGVLNAWVDWNQNGVFEAGEQIATNVAPTGNAIALNVTVPFNAVSGPTFAMFRYSSESNLGPLGIAPDGEVETYQVNITGAAPQLSLVKRATAVGSTTYSTVQNDPGDIDDDNAFWPAGYLQGEYQNISARPQEEIEYTIYYLSTGNTPITNVNVCDMVPANTTYVSGSMQISRGTAAPTTLTDNGGDDSGQFYSSSGPAPTVNCPTNNSRGAVVVNLAQPPSSLPNATGAGTPSDSYGYIRFRVRVD